MPPTCWANCPTLAMSSAVEPGAVVVMIPPRDQYVLPASRHRVSRDFHATVGHSGSVTPLRFGVLGALQVRVDGRPVTVPPGRQRAVLTCLLVHAGQPVSMDTLTEAAWGDALPRDPHGALHTVLSRLRSQLGDPLLQHGPAGYRLVMPPEAADAEQFESLLTDARSASPARARELLEQAASLWRGPAYGEYADAPFARAAAARLEGLRKDATEAHAAACIECGDHTAAIDVLTPLLAEYPFREQAVALAVTARYQAGRQADALEVLREHRTLLREELGLDPAPALVELEQRILGHRLPQTASRAPGPPGWLDTSTAFIGREDDLADLVDAVATNRVTRSEERRVGKDGRERRA